MCGICGIFHFDPDRPVDLHPLEDMNRRLSHRGPDGSAEWVSGPVGLGHRRLSIIDLSPAGTQPMKNEDGSVWIVFNGEIYNFQSLREDLRRKGHVFVSETDTEVIVHLYEEHGLDCLRFLRGMFAFAVWDERRQRLFLARDRAGKKPLKYFHDGRRFLFASELKSILAHPGVPREADPLALHLYLTYGYCPDPHTGFKQICKLPAAHYMTVDSSGVRIERYWQLSYAEKEERSEQSWCEELRHRLAESVRLRLISDVPLGVFLSGGVDSGAVTALAARALDRPVKTFSIGFSYEAYNELPYARLVAEKYGTDHHELVVEPKAMDVFPRLVRQYEEPFADSSALPSYYLAQYARQHVTVTLNGDGGDENFAGYERYSRFEKYNRLASALAPFGAGALLQPMARALFLPRSVSNPLRAAAQLLHPDAASRYVKMVSFLDPYKRREFYTPGFWDAVSATDPVEAYRPFLDAAQAGVDAVERAQYADFNVYLPGDLLPKVDIASMAHSMESRSPLLDHEFLEFTARIPQNLKIRDGAKKYIFKKAAEPLLPPELLRRPKKGFGIPIHDWFSGELRPLAHETLLSPAARERGLVRPEAVVSLLQRHDRGEKLGYYIWLLLFLEEWHRQFIDRPPD